MSRHKADNQDLDKELAALEERRAKLKKLIALRTEIGMLEITALSHKGAGESILTIVEEVCKGFNVSVESVMSESREDCICQPRHAIFWLANRVKGIPYKAIARAFDKQHCTVIHGVKVTKNRMDTDQRFKAILNKVSLACAQRLNRNGT